VTVLEATGAELARVRELLEAYVDELWQRSFPPDPVRVPDVEGRAFLVAHLEFVYVEPTARRSGIGRDLVRAFVAAASAGGAEHVTLDVDTSNEVGRAVWVRLGFAEYARRLATPLRALVERLEQPS
jgi:ribosomal protein S18 acetylase RimI-like enzyme